MDVPIEEIEKKRTVRLTTRGRKSGLPRTVTIWFVIAGRDTIWVQHAGPGSANWYHNLVHEPSVTLDFGAGPVPGRARPICEPEAIQEVLRRIRRKYLLGWLIQFLGRKRPPVAAEIRIESGNG